MPGQVLDDGLLHPPSPIIQPEYLDNLKANRSESSTSNPEVPEERRNSDLKHIELHYNADTKSIHSESPHTDRLKGSQVSGFSLFSELAKQRRPNLKITIPKTNTWNSKDSVLEEDSFKLPTIRDQEGENKQKAEGELGPQQVEGYFQDEPEQDLQDLEFQEYLICLIQTRVGHQALHLLEQISKRLVWRTLNILNRLIKHLLSLIYSQ